MGTGTSIPPHSNLKAQKIKSSGQRQGQPQLDQDFYASNCSSERLALWDSIERLASSTGTLVWIVGGDFNEVRYSNEKDTNHFFSNGQLLRQVNHSFIALIPKTMNVDSLDHYRPISLCNTLYKIFTKIMASRLQPLHPKLVSNHQSAFIKGRNIHHNILLAHELIRYLNHGKSKACIKVDIKKAFDSVN
ncbi:hypothetical protein QJS10_CPB12g00917 [Acorus calamus]|uniref:Reverse transcriptase domain-containing protein n=1 Tax=Acorus calamus TaxID=4465 RepID=A0AAV9DL68_ACOCL|nr:hypothetical protein QJS10_CPB12g00917 [Acorus calamus]